jgi:hypothetical protein
MMSFRVWGAVLGAVLFLTPSLSAQQGEDRVVTSVAAEEPEAELAFEREVFSYPTFARRNPFEPLLASTDGGPRWEGMRLEGVVYDADPRFSIAILSAGRARVRGNQGGADPAGTVGQMARLRVGEKWGNIRIIEIRKNHVLIEVEEFGLTEQREMHLPVRGQGGPR